jgi:hypothetical protein
MTGTKKKERLQQFREYGGPGGMSFSQELVSSALHLLGIALEQRLGPVFKTARNHYTNHAPAVVVLAVSAFDVWSTECSVGLEIHHPIFPKLAEAPTCVRYRQLLERLKGAPDSHEAELRTLVDIRDEVVHFLPRHLPNQALPAWMDVLNQRDLLIKSNHDDADFSLSQKLSSYALAHWACSTVSICAEKIISVVPADIAAFAGAATASNFANFRAFAEPAALPDFDLRRGIVL